ncbi:histidine utilization protein HutD [Chromobacterium sp. ATCC 53434]|uniref:HutD/Ves family protein n=1 Tax=Chromobacterium sp. (strain ATCC 53434 / SC 14030) TaxID=2059672 RepID=UPI000C7836AB|nr:HutD family protein [Chromobacterium sp. ATCC 53434]AUH52627.1 histidine utilization protein HutD [Chromobacterium sp. ATCC 53434]
MRVWDQRSFIDMPWANGGGRTRELFRLPHPERDGAFALRMSIAEVAAGGPFSRFDGVDRLLGLLDGEGMELSLADGRRLTLDAPGQVVAFTGEIGVECRLLGGALRDCNLMLARDWGRGEMERLTPADGDTVKLEAADLALLYLQRGAWSCGDRALSDGGLLLLENETASLRADGGAIAWLATARRHEKSRA